MSRDARLLSGREHDYTWRVMTKTYTLMTPGPVPLPEEVLAVLAQPMEHHRTPEFVALWRRVLANLKRVYMTKEPVFIHTATGSGAMESAIVNCLSPGDEIIAVVSGKFGERWAEIAETYGIKVHRIETPWGKPVPLEEIEESLERHPNAAALLSQACETSTGVLHPVREIAMLTRKHRALFMVDAITALGALPLPMDEWGIDVLIAGSQKAFMLPTGLSFISLSEKAWKAAERAACPRYYFDLRREKKANAAGESFFSASVTNVRALDLVLEIFLTRGLERVYERIQALALATRAAAQELGLRVFPEVPSPSLTAIEVPSGIDSQKLRVDMEKTDAVVVMGGQDQLKGKIIRIGHMGAIADEDLLKTIESLAQSINRLQAGTIDEGALARAKEVAARTLRETPAVVMKV